MKRWLLAAPLVIVLLYGAGWGLVVASGHGGNRTGGSVALWQLGGIMVYVAVFAAPLWAVVALTALGVKHLAKPTSREERGVYGAADA